MAFLRSVKEASQGYGSSANNGSVVGTVQVGAGTNTVVIPATGATTPSGGTAFNTSGGPPPTRGRGRLKVTALGGASTTQLTVTATDGSTTITLFVSPVSAANALPDWTFEFNTDINITSISFLVTFAVSGGTFDCEVSMTP